MTRNEVITLLQTIIVLYPGSKINPDALTVALWHEMLEDLPGDVVAAAVKRMCATLKFPPSIADIRENVKEAVREASGLLTAGEAWGKVVKAIRWYGWSRPEEARAALGETLWQAVGLVGGWTELCGSDDAMTVLSAQFERRYDAMVKQQMNLIQIPASVNEDMKRLVGPLTERLMIGGGIENAGGRQAACTGDAGAEREGNPAGAGVRGGERGRQREGGAEEEAAGGRLAGWAGDEGRVMEKMRRVQEALIAEETRARGARTRCLS